LDRVQIGDYLLISPTGGLRYTRKGCGKKKGGKGIIKRKETTETGGYWKETEKARKEKKKKKEDISTRRAKIG